MPKTRKRKKTTGQKATNRFSAESVARQEKTAHDLPARVVRQPGIYARGRGASTQNLVYSAMAALGFWGLTIFCIFFYLADPNHYLYGAIMGLTAVGWSVLVARRWLVYRQRA